MPKTFVLAPDSFKESMTAVEACKAMQAGIARIFPDAIFIQCPMADGGEGTLDTILAATHGQRLHYDVMGPLATQRVKCDIGLIDAGQTAIIEMAQANGLDLLARHERNPLLTSTYGTGQLILAALDLGVSKIVLGLGGSATNDAGMGMAAALGVKFLDAKKQPVALGGGYLHLIEHIDTTALDQRLARVEIIVANDVTNPLLGIHGATQVFAAQKGATPEMMLQLEHNLAHYAQLLQQQLNIQVQDIAGTGAAGGLTASLLAFTPAKIQSGVTTVIEMVGLIDAIEQADYVFTGEGGIDAQTQFGKTPVGVARVAQQFNKPVFACAGYVGADLEILYTQGITAIFGILDRCCDIEDACRAGATNLTRTCENIARLIKQHEIV